MSEKVKVGYNIDVLFGCINLPLATGHAAECGISNDHIVLTRSAMPTCNSCIDDALHVNRTIT
jgi:hypothetical protein